MNYWLIAIQKRNRSGKWEKACKPEYCPSTGHFEVAEVSAQDIEVEAGTPLRLVLVDELTGEPHQFRHITAT